MFKRVSATATYFTVIRGAVETATQRRWTITAGALRFADEIRVFLCTSAQRPSANWHIAVLPGAISRLCSVSWRQIPVWATDTPPHLQHGSRSLQRSLRIHSTISSLKTSHPTWHEASALIKFSYIHCASLIAVNLFSSARHFNYIMYKNSQ